MYPSDSDKFIISPSDKILITGATGFIGARVVDVLFRQGFRNVVCFARPYSDRSTLDLFRAMPNANVTVVTGNLLNPDDCVLATRDVAVVFHLAAGGSGKSYPDAFLNSVVTTRNLLEAGIRSGALRRFVNISSLAVYSNCHKKGRLLDESSPVESHPELRSDPYCFAKVKQDEIVAEYSRKYGLSSVVVRPAYVYGPGKGSIPSRVGIGTFGLFLHLGGSNRIPLTYVDNCAEAIVIAGLTKGTDGETFNVVDDDLPTSREFLRLYKRNVQRISSMYLPHTISYLLCWLWERYSYWSEGQLPPVFNRRRWHALWKHTRYSNHKLKRKAGWSPSVCTEVGLSNYFRSCRKEGPIA